MRSANLNTSSMSCSMNRIVTFFGSAAITPKSSALSAEGMPAAGSSRSRIRGRVASASAISTRRCRPYGKQRLVEIALALATKPRILLLDEPAAGIPTGESAELFGVIAALPRDVTILFIEHDMELVFRFAERITVLVGGKVLTEGAPAQIAADPRVREVYLGEAQHG